MEKKRILVTGIGGNVGQGILRIIRETFPEFVVIGIDINKFTPANYLCDKTIKVPYSYDESYIPVIKRIIEQESIDLIIPSTDYEVFYLSKHKKELNTTVLCSEFDAADIYIDKYKTYIHHKNNKIPFAKSYLPNEYNNTLKEIIAKPRKGRGSRGIVLNPKNIHQLGNEYMIQEYSRGIEITTAGYVTKEKKLLGFITLERKLSNGTTTECQVVKKYDNLLKPILKKMVKHSGILGSFNIQSIVNQEKEIIPFEVNCRISGTNSIRHNFGFQDVKYGIEEWLFDIPPQKPNIIKGVANRILLDVIYPNASGIDNLNSNSKFKIF